MDETQFIRHFALWLPIAMLVALVAWSATARFRGWRLPESKRKYALALSIVSLVFSAVAVSRRH